MDEENGIRRIYDNERSEAVGDFEQKRSKSVDPESVKLITANQEAGSINIEMHAGVSYNELPENAQRNRSTVHAIVAQNVFL